MAAIRKIRDSKAQLKMKVLSTEEQIAKLQEATRLALDAAQSQDIVRRIGSFLLFSGMVDFLSIQAARLMEQIILKGQLSEGLKPGFNPHEDSFFYDKAISTRKILKELRRLVRTLSAVTPNQESEAEHIKKLCEVMVEKGLEFLNYRNPIVHHLGNPKKKFEEIVGITDKALKSYEGFREAHKAFFEAAQPYRFGKKELEYFYAKPMLEESKD